MILTRTPMRISLFGGGTDLKAFWQEEEGCVLNCTINKYIYVIVKKSFDQLIHVNYFEQEEAETVDNIRHDLVRETMLRTGIRGGVEVVILSDIPHTGSGLGSSSSLTVGLLNAFYAYSGKKVSAETLSQQACEIEIDVLGKPIGKQDQYIAAYGGLNKILFRPDGSVKVEKVMQGADIVPDLQKYLLLFYTGIGHSSEKILREQSGLITQTRPVLRKIKEQVDEAIKIMSAGKMEGLGPLMQEGWELKSRLASQISGNGVGSLVERALKAGATGAKITGAGGGGFLMVFCKPELHNSVRSELNSLKELDFELEQDGAKILLEN
ncbi:MAG TPA: GHMP kinase [Ruminiclostridium sp.]|nr:GHMP kinase [Ruminiclostridium sp.]